MSKVPAVKQETQISSVESALVNNDLSKLSAEERLVYYKQICDSVGLNYLTSPFAYITLNGKLTLYARKDATEQLRKIHGVSTSIISKEQVGDAYEVHIRAKDNQGREDEDFASIHIKGLTAEALSNAKMKCVTKAKRRVTLSICGLGILDESEIDSIPPREVEPADNPQFKSNLQEKIAQVVGPKVESVPEVKNVRPGDYVCKIGKKFNGQKVSDIDQFQLDNYLQWLKKSAEDKNQPLSGDWLDFYEHAEAYLCSKEVPTVDPEEELPI